MQSSTSVSSLPAQVYQQIRAGIVRGAHSPGTPLRLAALAGQFGVSMSVIREALVRLSEQHLVELSPNQGFRVVSISRHDLVDITELRIALEGMALRRSIDHGGLDWEGHVVSSHHVLERVQARSEHMVPPDYDWTTAHSNFHEALTSGCESPRLITMIGKLRDSAEIYRQLSVPESQRQHRDVSGEHRALLELSIGRRGEAAVTALAAHIQATCDVVLSTVLVE